MNYGPDICACRGTAAGSARRDSRHKLGLQEDSTSLISYMKLLRVENLVEGSGRERGGRGEIFSVG